MRLPRLSERPLHTDEAIHAVKLGEILEHNGYRYDRYEYHGPTLNYFTLPLAWLRGQFTFSQLDEYTLRVVPVCFGLLLVLLLLPLVRYLEKPLLLMAAVLTALSPIMVFYSRYYIMEILLTAFTFGVIVSAFLYLRTRKSGWAVSTGVFMGLMHATKETCILVWGVMVLSLLPFIFSHRAQVKGFWSGLNKKHLWTGLFAGLAVSMLFFSSFGANPRGIVDSFLTFTNYFHKAGDFEIHIYPWYWYFQILLYNPSPMGVNWTEIFILLMSLFGFYAVFFNKLSGANDTGLLRYLAYYTLLLTLVYSVIPYKTPWIALGFWHGFILMAAVGIVFVYRFLKNRMLRYAFTIFMTIGILHLFWLSFVTNFEYMDNPYNPWVFSHPGKDVFTIEERVREVARCHPDGMDMRIDVICPGGDYWPLPWYLRQFPNVGWWTEVDMNSQPAPVILISPALEADLAVKLYELPPPGQRELYMPLFDDYVELRPTVEIRGYVVKPLFDAFYYQHEP